MKAYNRVGLIFALIATIGSILATTVCRAQVILSGTTYIQRFDSLTNGLPTGWTLYTNATATSFGGLADMVTNQNTWSATGFGFKDLASTISNSGTNFVGTESTTTQGAATNRCLGVRQTSGVAGGDPGAAFVVQVQNTLGLSQVQMGIDFQMLNVQTRSTSWRVDYALGSNPTNFIAVGTNYDDPNVFGTTSRLYSFGGAIDNQPTNVWIRVVALSLATGSGSRDTFGIDNFSLSYSSFTPTAPTITNQPSNQVVQEGRTAGFSVAASGSEPFSYQWQFNYTNLPAATAQALTITNVSASQAGPYRVIVTNAFGASTSLVAQLTVNPGSPLINGQPVSQIVTRGSNAVFSVSVVGTAPFSYRWIKNGTNALANSGTVIGATTPALTLVNVSTLDEGTYTVAITNSAGDSMSSPASLTVVGPPILSQQPDGTTAVAGENITLAVGVTGAPPLRYQWRFNGTNISSATNSNFTISNFQSTNAGSYFVVVTNQFGSVTSDNAVLKFATPIVQWNFNTATADTNTATGSVAPSFGTGTATLIGGVTATFAAGATSDPANGASDNSAWNTSSYPAQGTSNKTAGVQFTASTAGKENIVITWAHRVSSTASKIVRVQYSTNGTTFIDCPSSQSVAADSVFESKAERLLNVPGVNNNPNFAVRILTEFQSSALGGTNDNYTSVGTYGRTGTIRYDMVTMSGTDVAGTTLTLANPVFNAGKISFNINENAGNVIIETSTNLLNWLPIFTNVAPFTFATNAIGSRAFYRAILNQ